MPIRTALLAAALATVALPSAAMAGDQVFRVDLNKTQIVRLPAKAGSIVIGNPSIADVSVQNPDTVFVVGRGYGETNLVVLDRQGRTVMDADIQVTAVTPNHGVRVFSGSARRSYSCAPYCQPSPILGDETGFITANSGEEPSASGPGTLFETLFGASDATGTTGGLAGGVGAVGDSAQAPFGNSDF